MTPRLMDAAASSSRPRSSITDRGLSARMDLASLGRAPLRIGFGMGARRVTSTDLQIVEATEELLTADIPEPDGVAHDISLLRGFNATIPSSERGKSRRRQTRNVDTPRLGLKKLGMGARGLLMEEEETSTSEDDLVVVKSHNSKGKGKGKGRRRARESLGASVALGKDELQRQTGEILLDKENIHVRKVRNLDVCTYSLSP